MSIQRIMWAVALVAFGWDSAFAANAAMDANWVNFSLFVFAAAFAASAAILTRNLDCATTKTEGGP